MLKISGNTNSKLCLGLLHNFIVLEKQVHNYLPANEASEFC